MFASSPLPNTICAERSNDSVHALHREALGGGER